MDDFIATDSRNKMENCQQQQPLLFPEPVAPNCSLADDIPELVPNCDDMIGESRDDLETTDKDLSPPKLDVQRKMHKNVDVSTEKCNKTVYNTRNTPDYSLADDIPELAPNCDDVIGESRDDLETTDEDLRPPKLDVQRKMHKNVNVSTAKCKKTVYNTNQLKKMCRIFLEVVREHRSTSGRCPMFYEIWNLAHIRKLFLDKTAWELSSIFRQIIVPRLKEFVKIDDERDYILKNLSKFGTGRPLGRKRGHFNNDVAIQICQFVIRTLLDWPPARLMKELPGFTVLKKLWHLSRYQGLRLQISHKQFISTFHKVLLRLKDFVPNKQHRLLIFLNLPKLGISPKHYNMKEEGKFKKVMIEEMAKIQSAQKRKERKKAREARQRKELYLREKKKAREVTQRKELSNKASDLDTLRNICHFLIRTLRDWPPVEIFEKLPGFTALQQIWRLSRDHGFSFRDTPEAFSATFRRTIVPRLNELVPNEEDRLLILSNLPKLGIRAGRHNLPAANNAAEKTGDIEVRENKDGDDDKGENPEGSYHVIANVSNDKVTPIRTEHVQSNKRAQDKPKCVKMAEKAEAGSRLLKTFKKRRLRKINELMSKNRMKEYARKWRAKNFPNNLRRYQEESRRRYRETLEIWRKDDPDYQARRLKLELQNNRSAEDSAELFKIRECKVVVNMLDTRNFITRRPSPVQMEKCKVSEGSDNTVPPVGAEECENSQLSDSSVPPTNAEECENLTVSPIHIDEDENSEFSDDYHTSPKDAEQRENPEFSGKNAVLPTRTEECDNPEFFGSCNECPKNSNFSVSSIRSESPINYNRLFSSVTICSEKERKLVAEFFRKPRPKSGRIIHVDLSQPLPSKNSASKNVNHSEDKSKPISTCLESQIRKDCVMSTTTHSSEKPTNSEAGYSAAAFAQPISVQHRPALSDLRSFDSPAVTCQQHNEEISTLKTAIEELRRELAYHREHSDRFQEIGRQLIPKILRLENENMDLKCKVAQYREICQ